MVSHFLHWKLTNGGGNTIKDTRKRIHDKFKDFQGHYFSAKYPAESVRTRFARGPQEVCVQS